MLRLAYSGPRKRQVARPIHLVQVIFSCCLPTARGCPTICYLQVTGITYAVCGVWPIMVKRTTLQNAIAPGPFDRLPDRVQIFQIDRANMVLHLHGLQRAIGEGAEEMEMVAIERVFVKSVSQALTLTARKLYRVAEELNVLRRTVERSRLPTKPNSPREVAPATSTKAPELIRKYALPRRPKIPLLTDGCA